MMDKRIVKVIAAGVGAAFVLAACAVSTRQVVTGPNGLVVEPLNFTKIESKAAPAEAQPANERITLPASMQEQTLQQSSVPEQTSKAAPAADAAKSVEQVKAAEKATGYMSHECGYSYSQSYSSDANDD